MEKIKIDYAQLLETNCMIQQNADESYWLCATRTVQESKIFPVSAYILFSYLNCFYRYPTLLKKIESSMSAEEIGDRARLSGIKIAGLIFLESSKSSIFPEEKKGRRSFANKIPSILSNSVFITGNLE